MTVAFAIKAEVRDLSARTLVFRAQKTMYGGKRIAEGDAIFVFASENEGGVGLVARGVRALPPDRQPTNEIIGISDEAAAFLRGFF